MRIYLIRHARTQVIDGDYYGSGLSPQGVEATRALAASNCLPKPDLLLTSPFRRAIETAAILAEPHGITPELAPAFAEWRLQGQNIQGDAYLIEERSGWADLDLAVAGDESLRQLQQRAIAGVEEVMRRDAPTIFIVTHGTIIDVLCAHLGGRPPVHADIEHMPYLAYAIVETVDGKPALLRDIIDPPEE